MASEPAGRISVVVCYAQPHDAWECRLVLAAGATAAEAVAASGFAGRFPGIDPWLAGVGIFGHSTAPGRVLANGDRIEIYRALTFDPMESRRRRAAHRSRKMPVARPQRTPKAIR